MTTLLDDLFFLLGCAAIWYGARLVHPAAGWVVGGLWLVAIAYGGRIRRERAQAAAKANAPKAKAAAP